MHGSGCLECHGNGLGIGLVLFAWHGAAMKPGRVELFRPTGPRATSGKKLQHVPDRFATDNIGGNWHIKLLCTRSLMLPVFQKDGFVRP